MTFFAHESAYVDDGCEIGEGTKIWHFCHVQGGAKIGRACVLGQNVNVAGGVTIGDGVKIQNNVSIYTGTVIEDFVFLGAVRRSAPTRPSSAARRSGGMPSSRPAPSSPGTCPITR
jgi:UDP-3-O-[3-hydroxymyristoyl] glucosamine N-acyltransferase